MKKFIIALGAAAAMLCVSANLFAQEEQKPLRKKVSMSFSSSIKDPETKKPTGEYKSAWSFASPKLKSSAPAEFVGEEFVASKKDGFEVKILSKQGVWRDKDGMFVGGQDSYFEFPGEEKMKLSYIRFTLVDVAKAANLRVVDAASGEAVKGGDTFVEKDGKTYFKLSPKLGQALRLVLSADETIQFRNISVDYREPAPKKK